MHGRGSITVLSKVFCLTVQRDFLREPSVCDKIRGLEKNMDERRGITIFGRKFFVSQSQKIVGEHFGVSEPSVSKHFMYKTGISLISVDFFKTHNAIKFVGEAFCVSKNF